MRGWSSVDQPKLGWFTEGSVTDVYSGLPRRVFRLKVSRDLDPRQKARLIVDNLSAVPEGVSGS